MNDGSADRLQLPIVWMMVNCKNGISSYEVARAIGITQKSAWFMLHRIRTSLKDGVDIKIDVDSGPIEVDETFIGVECQNMHRSRRERHEGREGRGRGQGHV